MMKHIQSLLLLKLGVIILLIAPPSYLLDAKKITSINNEKQLKNFLSRKDYVIMLIGNRLSKQTKKQRRIIKHTISSSKSKKISFCEVIHPSVHSEEIMKLFSVTKEDLPCTIIYRKGALAASQKGVQQKKDLLKGLKKASRIGKVLTITDDGFEKATDKKGYSVVGFGFGTPKSKDPLKQLKAVAKKLAGKMSFYKINTDKHSEYKKQYKVSDAPTVLVFKNGEMIKKLTGYQSRSKAKLLQELKTILGSTVRSLTDAQFESATKNGLVLVDFWAPWCGPCLALAPHLEAAAKDLGSKVAFYKINTDDNKKYMNRYGINGIPTLLIFKNGKMVKKMGAQTKEGLINTLKSIGY